MTQSTIADHQIICWNDPVNLFAYVIHVLQTVFHMDEKTAQKHAEDIHQKGHTVLVEESQEHAEAHLAQLLPYQLTVTIEKISTTPV